MNAPSDIDDAIGRLDEAVHGAGLPGLEPPGDLTAVERIVDDVAPAVLPAELRRFWERVDPEPVAIYTFPMLRGPAHALELLRGLRENMVEVPIGPPPMFLPLDYASHCYGVIELESAWSDGGTIVEWDIGALRLVAHSLADRIDLLAELLAEGRFDRGDGYVCIDHVAEQERRTARLKASGPHPVYGDARDIPADLASWPAHWLAASGIDPGERVPIGATHSIAELVRIAGTGTVIGRIHAEVTSLAGSRTGSRVVVDDGTGSLDVWCPSGTSPWGPVHRQKFEFEVAIVGPMRPPPDLDAPHRDVTRHALAGDLGAAQEAALELVGRLESHRSAAVATDIRPLE